MTRMFFDGHTDTLKSLYLSGRDFLVRGNEGHLDLPRARDGGVVGGLFSIQVPAEREEERKFGYGLTLTSKAWRVELAAEVSRQFAEHFVEEVMKSFQNTLDRSKEVCLVTDYAGLKACVEGGSFAVVLHYEGAEAIASDLSNLEGHYARGLRALAPVWSRPNAFGCGAAFIYPSGRADGPGLSHAGRRLVEQCNDLGIMIDLAHMTDAAFWDTASSTQLPLVVTHAGAQEVCPSATNLTNDQIDAVGATGGVIGVLFDVVNTRPDGRDVLATPLEHVLEHFEYIAERIGLAHVAFGSDFDGGMMPCCLDSAAKIPRLLDALRRRGYNETEIDKVSYENWFRVLRQSWKE